MTTTARFTSLADVDGFIRAFLTASPDNSLQNPANEPAWDDCLVGAAAGDDPIWRFYKQDIGEFFFLPEEIFNLTYPDSPARAEELTVISYILPHREIVKADQRQAETWPCERWVRARIFGEKGNAKLRAALAESLTAAGHPAVAPQLSPHWKQLKDSKYGYASSWSERHAAYAAGLGTFGLCDGLITAKGKALRAGSVVARVKLPTTPRPYQDHHAYCLFHADGSCGVCIERCPVGALSESGHDKVKCGEYTLKVASQYAKEHYGFDGYGCGLCQTRVPCESGIPKGLA